jgi:hypothetical protein
MSALLSTTSQLLSLPLSNEDEYRLCYIRGPEGIIIALAEQLG